MEKANEFIEMFKEVNALLEGHFELSSGKHSDQYFQCALVLQYPEYCEALAKEIADSFRDQGITCVIGPALGGVTIAYELARQLGCRSVFAEREENKMQLRRGFSISKDDKVLLVEDVVTTGGSILEVANLVEGKSVPIAGFCCIVDRSSNQTNFPYPLRSLVQMTPNLYDPESCPLCRGGVPVIKPGSKK